MEAEAAMKAHPVVLGGCWTSEMTETILIDIET